jgi:hypothetical protein
VKDGTMQYKLHEWKKNNVKGIFLMRILEKNVGMVKFWG